MSSWRPEDPPPRWLRRASPRTRLLLRWAAGVAGVAALLGFSFAFFYGALAMRFDINKVADMPARTVIYDRASRELDAGGSGSRRIITRERIPDFLVLALQAREDARFFQHRGIDVRGLARATLRNLKDRSFTQGASTLTMQLARNTFDMRAKSLHRKFLEIALTLRIEQHYPKNDILVHYLNRIYFGAGCNGIEEAALTYFGKPAAELHPGQCALLVGIIRGPHVFSPFRNPQAAIQQRDQVLERMIAAGTLTAEERDRIAALPLDFVPEESRAPERSYALQAIHAELDTILDDAAINEGGLHVISTLDSGWQIKLESDLARAIANLESSSSWPHPKHADHRQGDLPAYLQTAAVTLETNTGAVLALIGGRDFLDSRFDRSAGARRDLGSAFQPFLGAAAAERGRLVLQGKPVQTGRQVGPDEVRRIARRCGLGGPFAATEDLFRGAAAATPREAATALATLGSNGKRPKPFFILEVRDRTGATIYQSQPNRSPALGEAAARDALSLFTKKNSTRTLTGATTSCRDAWILRLGPRGSTALWIGFDQPAAIAPAGQLDSLLTRLASQLAE